MENQQHPIELLVERAEEYSKASIELYRLKALHRSAEIISGFMTKLIILSFFILFFLILNIGIALWLGDILKQNYWGFFIVAGFYALLGILLYFFRNKWVKDPIKN